MSKKWCGITLAAIGACVFLSLTAFAAEVGAGPAPAPMVAVELPEGVIATVNGEAITQSEWLDVLKKVAGRGVLEEMIRRKAVEIAAKNAGVEVSDSELQVLIDNQAAAVGGMQNLQGRLAQMGQTLDDLRDGLRTMTLLRKMVAKEITVSDEEAEKVFLEQYGRKADVQVIVLPTQEKAEVVLAQVGAGADFTQVAEKESVDPATKGNHGYLPGPLTDGFFPKNAGVVSIDKETADKIFALEEGGISTIIPGPQQGLYIFKLVKHYPAQDVKLADVKEDVRTEALEQKMREAIQYRLQQIVQTAVVKRGI